MLFYQGFIAFLLRASDIVMNFSSNMFFCFYFVL